VSALEDFQELRNDEITVCTRYVGTSAGTQMDKTDRIDTQAWYLVIFPVVPSLFMTGTVLAWYHVEWPRFAFILDFVVLLLFMVIAATTIAIAVVILIFSGMTGDFACLAASTTIRLIKDSWTPFQIEPRI
jgi:hypothetical protein